MEHKADESGMGGAQGAGPGPGRGGHGASAGDSGGASHGAPERAPERAGRGGDGAAGGETSRLTWARASGDPDAFARFYELWFDRVYAIARRATGRDEAFCLDIVQESFMKMIAKMKRIDSDAALGVWIKRVVTRTALDAMRAERRRTRREGVKGEAGPSAFDAPGEPRGGGSDADRLGWLETELARLEREEADMLLARHRFGWTLKAIGDAFGLSPGAVDGRLSRIVARLRERAHEQGGTEREGARDD